MDVPSAQTLAQMADSTAPEPRLRYFSREGVYLRPSIAPNHARTWAEILRFLKWGAAAAILGITFDPGSFGFIPPGPFSLAGIGFFLAMFQLLGAYEAFFVLDPPLMPRPGRSELWIPHWGLLLLALVCSWGFLLLVAATTWVPAMLLRRSGWRMVYAPDYAPGKQETTFSLSGLFGLTTCLAVVLGVVSGLLRLSENQAAGPLILLALLFASGVSPLAWFLPRPVNWWAGGFAIGLLAGIAGWVNLATHEAGTFVVIGTNLAVCHGVALAVQRAGFRLLRLPKEMRRPRNPFVWMGKPKG